MVLERDAKAKNKLYEDSTVCFSDILLLEKFMNLLG